ncbi:MAG: hydroxylamine oxidation protein HaoB [Gammaproteobacteria bacterium]|nr:hydroxylamine oxidation protein HaoB [Gammaproteobacteria bacterium]
MPIKLESVKLRKSVLIAISAALLITGGAVLYPQLRIVWNNRVASTADSSSFSLQRKQGQATDLQGAFPADSVTAYNITWQGKDASGFLLAHYKDKNQPHRVMLYHAGKPSTGSVLPNPNELRQSIWQEAAQAITRNTAPNALFLSWWDDGQRIHFLSGRDAWIKNPAAISFDQAAMRPLQDDMPIASEVETKELAAMARWLTMDCDQAVVDIKKTFGKARPVYLLITTDLLYRLQELESYGGARLNFAANAFNAHDNLHGDIAQIKRWAQDQGNGDYLVQKNGLSYRMWSPKTDSAGEKNTLLVRLLPFVNSLKHLPEGLKLVYQNHWGGYLAIYQLTAE